MKAGVRALGIAESYRDDRSTLAGVVSTTEGVVDGFSFEDCTVGGSDATAAVVAIYEDLDREDVQFVVLAGVALAWYNVVDLAAVHRAVDRPVLSVTFEESEGLTGALREEFSGAALETRLETYRSLPERRETTVNGERIFVRSVGLDRDPSEVVAAYTPRGGRPEPVRIARLAARAADAYVRRTTDA